MGHTTINNGPVQTNRNSIKKIFPQINTVLAEHIQEQT